MTLRTRARFAWPPQDVGAAIVQLKMTGDLVLMTKRAYPIANINQRAELEAQFVKSANHALGKLVQDTRFIYDPTNKRVTARSMLISQSRTPNMPAFAIGSEISSNSPLPKLRAEIRLPKLEGFYDFFRYTAIDVKIVLEITPKLQRPSGPGGGTAVTNPVALVVPGVAPKARPNPDDFDAWVFVTGAGLTMTAVGIVTATVVEDFLTGMAGVADDPASFALAGRRWQPACR
jgi:hypothetical protein